MLKYSMSVNLLTKHHLEFLSSKGGCTGSSESILVKCLFLEIKCHGSYCFWCGSCQRWHLRSTVIYLPTKGVGKTLFMARMLWTLALPQHFLVCKIHVFHELVGRLEFCMEITLGA